MANVVEQLQRLVLSAVEVREATGWKDSMVEDYLNILNDTVLLATNIDADQLSIATLNADIKNVEQQLFALESKVMKNAAQVNAAQKERDNLRQLIYAW